MRRKPFSTFLSRNVFGDKPDYGQLLRSFSGELISLVEPDAVAGAMMARATEALHVARAYVLLLASEEDRTTAKAVGGIKGTIGGDILQKGQPVRRLLEERKAIVAVAEEPDILRPFREQGMQLLVPLIARDRLLAVLCLGPKRSGDACTGEDLHFLATMADLAALAIENARLSLSLRVLEKNLLQADKMAALGALASGLAHEIRNPLASVKTFCQLVARKSSEQSFVDRFNDVVPREIERLERVLDRLLDLSKRPASALAPVKVERVLEDLLALLHYEAVKGNVTVIRCYDEASLPVLAAGEEIKQLFMNMALNAIQAMPDGGSLTIATGRSPGSGIPQTVVSFKDSGAGIPAGNLEKLFMPFFSTRENGTGLGLFIAKQIISKYNGAIDIESVEGQGTTFTLRLPGCLSAS